MDIITTDNIKKDVKNPSTNNSGMRIALMLLILFAIILLLTIYNKSHLSKYVIILFIMLSTPIVYAICTIEIKVESKIEIEKLEPLNKTLISMAKKENSCMSKYEGNVTEEVDKTVSATKVYFDTCEERNVIFGGFCWQVIRTTETGGVKMIYNGEPVDGKCESTRSKHKGIIVASNSTLQFNDTEYLYGNSFIYDNTTNTFTLLDTTTITMPSLWDSVSVPDMQRIFGKYTCRNNTGTCDIMYHINSYTDNVFLFYTTGYSIGDTSYGNIGYSPFNANYRNPTSVGYMFNKVVNIDYHYGRIPSNYLFGNNVSYSTDSHAYTLLPTNGESTLGTVLDRNHHYTCRSEADTCSNMAYYFRNNYFIYLNGAPNIQSAINEMFYNDDVNKYNSSIKGVIDSWYAQNLTDKTDKLEDIVYCNARNITNLNTSSWNPNGGLDYNNNFMKFGNEEISKLDCLYDTDQFAVSNRKAKLTYPVGLISWDELYQLGFTSAANNLRNEASGYWTLTPRSFGVESFMSFIYSGGYLYQADESPPNGAAALGVRPAISLNSENLIVSGTGTEADPWVIKEN